jgi:phytoene synthase
MKAATEDPYLYCERLVRRRESNFSLGFPFLPAPKRRAIHVVYAFCRYVDDISDESAGGGPSAIPELLGRWRGELDAIYRRGTSGHPIGRALVEVLKSFPIPAEGFLDLIRGCEQDQEKRRYAAFDELSGYCDLVATSIAKVSVPVYGAADPVRAVGPARALSFAFQLTNILRDVREDLGRDRIYLPAEDLERFGVGPEDLRTGSNRAALEALYRFEGERAAVYFQKGGEVLEYLHPDSRRCVRVMTGAYRTLLDKILADPVRALERQTVLTDEDKRRITHA